MWKRLNRKKTSKRGYTLIELLTVVGIIAIVCAIAVPSVIAIRNALAFKRHNDYAESIFMAAQANLTEMRSDGGLTPLQEKPDGTMPGGSCKLTSGMSGFPAAEWSEEYAYTVSGTASYEILLPVGSVDEAARSQQVLAEYNPVTGNVYSVFYSEDETADLKNLYETAGLPRDEAARRDMMLGYYCGSGLSSSALEVQHSKTEISFENGEEAVVTVAVAIPDEYLASQSTFISGLEVELKVSGEISRLVREQEAEAAGTTADETDYSYKVKIKEAGNPGTSRIGIDGKTVTMTYVLDSLANYRSFANLSSGTAEGAAKASLTAIAQENAFKILPGDNVTLTANVKFTPPAGQPAVRVENGILSGVNPLYDYLAPSATQNGKFILGVRNGRNLQNLNIMSPTLAKKVENVMFTDDIYWSGTVDYYNRKYGAGGTYGNAAEEAPGRSLPYFVPIHHEDLFGTAQFIYPKNNAGWLENLIIGALETLFPHTDIRTKSEVPFLTDSLDTNRAVPPAVISGNDHKVYDLVIDSSAYAIPNASSADEQKRGRYYATGEYQRIDYRFTGLFGYANTTIDGIHVVNPRIKGRGFEGDSSPAAGCLLGVGGYNTLVTNCSTYLDTAAPGFSYADLNRRDYGVTGWGSVGGLVGYAKSHRTVIGELDKNLEHLAFADCFAAVPVTGTMQPYRHDSIRNGPVKDYGYSNGVGGFIGNSELTNFYSCYASGDVVSYNGAVCNSNGVSNGEAFLPSTEDVVNFLRVLFGGEPISLDYNGRTSYGSGGFVGTSHGTRYTACFATGDVQAKGNKIHRDHDSYGVGGFVGVMTYDETYLYGADRPGQSVEIAQRTVFDSCYAAGSPEVDGRSQERFSGANARIRIKLSDILNTDKLLRGEDLFTPDYYHLLAPYYDKYNKAPAIHNSLYYIYKDSYFLSSRNQESANSNTNECANVASYDTLSNLAANHRSAQWQTDRINQVKAQECWLRSDFLNLPKGKTTYDTKYFHHYHWEGILNLDLVVDGYRPEMENIYRTKYAEGFSDTDWSQPTAANTHSYSPYQTGSTYPFTKLTGLDYYGDWPKRPLDSGLAYYEKYEDGTKGFYFDRDNTENLQLQSDKIVISDGYAILAGNRSDTVTLIDGGREIPLTSTGEYTPKGDYSDTTFGVFPIPEEYLRADSEKFYTQLTVKIKPQGSAEGIYTFYYNPNVALTQINPAYGSKTASRPATPPQRILIRSARQLAALGTMQNFWGEEYNYFQQLDIDGSLYNWSSEALRNAEFVPMNSIGTAEYPFNGSYTGGTDSFASIRGMIPAGSAGQPSGFFGTVGKTGRVQNLNIELAADGVLSVGDGKASALGILAGSVEGSADQITLTLTHKNPETEGAQDAVFTLASAGSTGALAGTSSGSITNCSVVTGPKTQLVLRADNAEKTGTAGTVLGSTTGGTVTGCTAATEGSFVPGGGFAGGFAGRAKDTAFENIRVTAGAVHSEAPMAGGFAGSVSGGSAKLVTVGLTGAVQAENSLFAGFAAEISGMEGVAEEVLIEGNVSADRALGFAGTAQNLKLENSKVTLKSELYGKTLAAGFADTVGTGSAVSSMTVDLSAGTVRSDAQAAGFAGTVRGNISASHVRLTADAEKAVISGARAAGFAAAVDGGEISRCSVSGMGRITGSEQAAGFAGTVTGENGRIAASFVTPVPNDGVSTYLGSGLYNLTVSGGESAGFVNTVETSAEDHSKAGVTNSYTLCTLEGTAAGFAKTNTGKINGCTANVALSGGSAFVAENTGFIANSYGWFADGTQPSAMASMVPEGDGVCRSSYFADMDPLKPQDAAANPDYSDVRLYDHNGKLTGVTSLTLPNSLHHLNGADARWFPAGPDSFKSYPFSGEIDPPVYPFPMLRDHYGDWLTPPEAAFGVAYYETYATASGVSAEGGTAEYQNVIRMHLEDLSNPFRPLENGSLSFADRLFAADGTPIEAQITGPITGTGYALFCMEDANPFDDPSILGGRSEVLANVRIPDAQAEYVFYELNADGKVTVSGNRTETPAKVNTLFANELQDDGEYEIRTAAQFANVASEPAAKFTQTADIPDVPAFTPVASFTGSYDGTGRTLEIADGTAGWFGEMNGTVSNLTVRIHSALGTPVFGTVGGSVSLNGLTADGGAAAGSITSAVTETGSFSCPGFAAGDVTGSLFGNVAGSVSLTGDLTAGNVGGSLFETVTGTVSLAGNLTAGDVTGSVFGSIAGTVNPAGSWTAGNVSGSLIGTLKSDLNLPAVNTQAISGSLIGSVENCALTAATVDANGADVTASVIGSVNTASVSGLQVQNGTLKAPVIGSAQGAELSGISVLVRSAELDTASGAAGVLAGSTVQSNLTGCTVKVPLVTVSGGGTFGMLAGSVSEGSITACSVQPAGALLRAQAGTVGGIAGETGGVLSGNTISGLMMELTGKENTVTAAGGMAGVNSGSITGGSANITMTYIQPKEISAGEAAEIGGIAGRMNGGSLDNITASGEILLKVYQNDPNAPESGTDSGSGTQPDSGAVPPAQILADGTGAGRNYCVGGAAGSENASETPAAYSTVTASAGISAAWADETAAENGTDSTAHMGSIGTFIGRARSGVFTNCAGNAPDNAKFHFLGRIDMQEAPAAAEYRNTVQKEPETLRGTAETDPELDGDYTKTEEGETARSYAAELNECFFTLGADRMQQKIEADRFYYHKEGPIRDLLRTAVKAAAEFTPQTVTYKALAAGETNKPQLTDYYGYTEQSGYFRLWVEVEKSRRRYVYTLTNQNGEKYAVSDKIRGSERDQVWILPDGQQLYTQNPIAAGTYLIVNEKNEMLSVNAESKPVWVPFDPSAVPAGNETRWNLTNEEGTVSLQNSANGMYLNGSFALKADPVNIQIRAEDGTGDRFAIGNKTGLRLMTVTEQDNGWYAVYTYAGQFSEVLKAQQAAQPPAAPAESTAKSSAEPADPAQSGAEPAENAAQPSADSADTQKGGA